MKKLILAIVGLSLAIHTWAAEGEWTTDLAKAKAKAKEEKKMVLADFTGSDWCPPCKALHKNVFSSKEFQEYAKKNLVLVEVDFPRAKQQSPELKKANRELAEKHGIEAYPTVIVFDSNGKELKKSAGYGGQSAKDFIAELDKLKNKG
jgi:thioredoxin-related protein